MKRNIYLVWEDQSNIWTMYFTKNPTGSYDSNTSVSNTNSGGYIVTSRKSKKSLITVNDSGNKVKNDMRRSLVMKLNSINTEPREWADFFPVVIFYALLLLYSWRCLLWLYSCHPIHTSFCLYEWLYCRETWFCLDTIIQAPESPLRKYCFLFWYVQGL